MTRIHHPKYPAIDWSIRARSKADGLDTLIHTLERRYNPIMTDEKLEITNSPARPYTGREWRLLINKDGKIYGNVKIQYWGEDYSQYTSDQNETMPRQKFRTYFNFDDRSYMERDMFPEE